MPGKRNIQERDKEGHFWQLAMPLYSMNGSVFNGKY